jgi:hypothetical protein
VPHIRPRPVHDLSFEINVRDTRDSDKLGVSGSVYQLLYDKAFWLSYCKYGE